MADNNLCPAWRNGERQPPGGSSEGRAPMRIVKINRASSGSVSAVVPLHLSGPPPGYWLRGQSVLLLCLGVFLVLLAPLIAFGPDLLTLVQPATATVVIVPASDWEQATVTLYAASNGSQGPGQVSARLLSAGVPV